MISTGIGRRFEDGQVIVQQGERAERLHVVLDGEVELVRQEPEGELPIAVVPSGAMFGELAILDDQVHETTARARGEVRILTIDRQMLLRRCKEDPSFGIRILQRLVERIRGLTQDLASLKRAGPRS